MKTTLFLLTFLVATLARTDPDKPSVFCVKVGEKYVPLSGHFWGDSFGDSRVLSYGESDTPIQFFLENSKAFTKQNFSKGFLGIMGSTISCGSYIIPIHLDLDSQFRIRNFSFYACDIFHNGVRAILYKQINSAPYCFPVDIYFLQWDTERRLVIEPVPEVGQIQLPEKEVEKEKESMSLALDTPFAFYAKVGYTYIPLSGHLFQEFNAKDSVFSYSMICSFYLYGTSLAHHNKFFLKDGYAYTNSSYTPGYVGIQQDGLFFGPNTIQTKIDLDEKRRLRNNKYYSCQSIKNLRVITTSQDYDSCFEVEIYLLPYE